MIGFLTLTFLLAFSPGPAMIYTINQTLAYGRPSGLRAALGIHLASYVHVFVAVTGAGFILQQSAVFHPLLKMVGCVFLMGMSLSTLLSKPTKLGTMASAPQITNAFLVEALNPKSMIFFTSLLPQYADPSLSSPLWLQMLTYGVLANGVFSLAEVAIVVLVSPFLRNFSAASALQSRIRPISSLVLFGLAAHLLLQQV